MLLEWMHTDSRDLGPAITAGLVRAQTMQWSAGDAASIADFRALLVATAVIGKNLLHEDLTIGQGGEQVVDATTPLDPTQLADRSDSARGAQQLAKNLATLAEFAQMVGGVTTTFAFHFQTTDGGNPVDEIPAVTPPQAGNPLIIGAVAAVVISAIYAASVCYLGHEAAPVIEHSIAAHEETNRLIADHATALGVLQLHANKEKDAGQRLDFDAGERDVLKMVESSRKDAETRMRELVKQGEPKSFLASLGEPVVIGAGFLVGFLAARAISSKRA